MPFNPALPVNDSLIVAEELREQFISLKAFIDAQAAQIVALTAQLAALSTEVAALAFSQVPIAGVVPWHKNNPGAPALPANFVECNGQTLNDPESPLDGTTIPDYNNAGLFPKGGLTSDSVGGNDTFGTGIAEAFAGGSAITVVSPDFSPGASPIPPFVTAVFVMRVK